MPRPLTQEQQALAADPRNRALVARIARRYAARWPHFRDEFVSAALLALCETAARFDAGRGIPFEKFLVPRAVGVCLDVVRMNTPQGFRRAPAESPCVVSITARLRVSRGNSSISTVGDIIPARELPIGWEIESEDEVRRLARVAARVSAEPDTGRPPATAERERELVLLYLGAEFGGRTAAVARAVGCGYAAVARHLWQMRKHFGGAAGRFGGRTTPKPA